MLIWKNVLKHIYNCYFIIHTFDQQHIYNTVIFEYVHLSTYILESVLFRLTRFFWSNFRVYCAHKKYSISRNILSEIWHFGTNHWNTSELIHFLWCCDRDNCRYLGQDSLRNVLTYQDCNGDFERVVADSKHFTGAGYNS